MLLESDIKFLAGVGPNKASLLNKELEVFTFEDLLHYYPYKYIDKSKFYKINEISSSQAYIQLRGKIIRFETAGAKYKQRFIAHFADETGNIELVWFKGINWIKKYLQTNVEYIVFGKPSVFNRKINIIHPEIEEAIKENKHINASLQGHYHTSEKMKNSFLTSRAIQKLMQSLIQNTQANIKETLPGYLITKYNLLPFKEAIVNIHFPKDIKTLEKARFRLKLEELLYIQLNILQQKTYRHKTIAGFVFSKIGKYFNSFYNNNLPFELTNAQKKVIKEIRKDLGSGKQMNRLLQGDVGSGKTLVALMTMLIAKDNNFQSCLMAPTEVLANQHLKSITKFLENTGVEIALLTGHTRKKQREEIHKRILNSEIDILIGTHALLEDIVQFKNLGLVIIDEQHRFGVEQRARLWKKNDKPPHILVMTATPIPRTLAMTVYGDLDTSIIDELPPGRKAVKTIHFFDSGRLKMFGLLKNEIAKGRQVYIVYPLIKESEKMDYKDLEDGYESIVREFPIPDYQVSIVHGKMKKEAKDIEMNRFVKGETQIMVATTVIEVGVDIPNASVMVIESAERFGLSQLHQLRGRVGRGADQSYCILMSSYKLSNEGRKRLETIVQSNDGFEIAEADLKLRGPGLIDGTQQSGVAFNLKIANLAKDGNILQYARDIATQILKEDPELILDKNRTISYQLKAKRKSNTDWSMIS